MRFCSCRSVVIRIVDSYYIYIYYIYIYIYSVQLSILCIPSVLEVTEYNMYKNIYDLMHRFHSSAFVLFMMRLLIILYASGNCYVPISIPGPCMLTLVFLLFHVLLQSSIGKLKPTGKISRGNYTPRCTETVSTIPHK